MSTIPVSNGQNTEHTPTENEMGGNEINGEKEGRCSSEATNRVDGGNEAGEEEDRSAAQCIWIARVRPEDCEGIVKFTVLQGKVVKPERQLRGGFDRERGLASW